MNKRKTGSFYEDMAAGYLTSIGFTVIERNFSCRTGEVDIIASEGETLCFVEVKYRSSERMGYPSEAVGTRKQGKIRRVAQYYMLTRDINDREIRFDVVEILNDGIRLYRNAF